MKKVLVTGGCGYIGSHVALQLEKEGYTPLILDSLELGFAENALGKKVYSGQLQDKELLGAIFKEHRPEIVLHFAAYSSVEESVNSPLKYYENNLGGTLSLLGVMQEFACKKIVFSSTAAVYGDQKSMPIDENAALAPVNPYGRSKLYVENVLKSLADEAGISSVSLRYFNACGASLSGKLGDRRRKPTHLIPRVIFAALRGDPFSVYGDDYPTHDGSAVRDYIHVEDLANAHVKAVEFLQKNVGAYAFNLGSGKGISVKEVVRAVEKMSHTHLRVSIEGRRQGDPAELVANPLLAEKSLGWKAVNSDIETIVKTAYEWQKGMTA